MSGTVRGFCTQVYEYVKSDMKSDYLENYKESSPHLEHNAEVMAARIGLADDPQRRTEAMRMLEETGVLPMLLFKRKDSFDRNSNGDIDRSDLEEVLQDPQTGILDAIAAEYALTRFDEIRDGFDPFDWYTNLEDGEMWDHAMRAKSSSNVDPEKAYYGPVTLAPPIGDDADEDGRKCGSQ